MNMRPISADERDEIVNAIKAIVRRHQLGARTFGKFAAVARAEMKQTAGRASQ